MKPLLKLLASILFISALSLIMAADVPREDVLRITGNIICKCGCPPTLVKACSCDQAAITTREVEGLLAEGKSDDEIYAFYIAKHGPSVLAAPRAEGFNLIGWVFPFVAVLIGGGIVLVAYRNLRVVSSAADPTVPKSATVDRKYRKLLERDLAE